MLVEGVKLMGRATKGAAGTMKDAAGTVVEKISDKMPAGDKEEPRPAGPEGVGA